MAQMVVCPSCQKLNRPAATFCSHCGARLSALQAGQPLTPNQTLQGGKYCVVQPLGKGGMGAVYLVTQVVARVTRQLVIKELIDYWDPNDPQGPTKAQRRFEDEAATLTQLAHPGIPKIFDFFSEKISGQDRNFIVMEYVEGDSLDKRLTRFDSQGRLIPGAPVPANDVIAWGIQLCRVLEYLASRLQPIIHHDIKPANIILDKNSGEVRLVDFGTAKAQLVLQPGSTVGKQKSSIYGTAGYAPPEQYDQPNKPPRTEPRSDVYALGATLYHLLTDDDPRDHPFDFPRLTGLPGHIREALTPALELDVAKRVTALELRRHLEALATPRLTVTIQTRSGKPIDDMASLILFADGNWQEACDHLFNRDFEVWLGQLRQPQLIPVAADSRLHFDKQRDRGLERFLAECEKAGFPRPDRPRLVIQPNVIQFGEICYGDSRQIKIENRGKGYFFGTASTQAPWLNLSITRFEGNRSYDLILFANCNAMPVDQSLQEFVHFDTSGGQFDLAVQASRVNAQVYLARARSAYSTRQFDLALKTFQDSLNLNPTGAERNRATTAIAVIYYELGRLQDCRQWCQQHKPALSEFDPPKSSLPASSLAQFCHFWADELYKAQGPSSTDTSWKEVIDWYEQAHRLDPTLVDEVMLAHVYLDYAQAHCARWQFDEALTAFHKADALAKPVSPSHSLFPRYTQLAERFVVQARAHRQAGEFERAVTRYVQAQQISLPAAPDRELAAIYAEHGRAICYTDIGRAAELLQRAQGLAPQNAQIERDRIRYEAYATQDVRVGHLILGGFLGTVAGAVVAWVIGLFLARTGISMLVALAVSGTFVYLAGILGLLWRERRRAFLGRDLGGVPFVLGLALSNALWTITLTLVGVVSAILLARYSLTGDLLRVLTEVVLIGICASAVFDLVKGQSFKGDLISFLLRLALTVAIFGGPFGLLGGWFVGIWTSGNLGLICIGLIVIFSYIALLSMVFSDKNDDREAGIGCSLTLTILAIISIFALRFWGFTFPFSSEWAWSAALLGVWLALIRGPFQAVEDGWLESETFEPGSSLAIGFGIVALLTGIIISIRVSGGLGLVWGMGYASVLIGSMGFVSNYLSGQGSAPKNWKKLSIRNRLIALGVALGAIILVALANSALS